ncbi:MAG: DNA-3-methyladenine glycosylase I [Phycisphaerae bacterium]|nr:DNA-3-methyladenine glycosylase I [Phycisphaerae bacterium]
MKSNSSHDQPPRCPWAKTDLSIAYHDAEWGVPLHDDQKLFEFIVLDGAQAGLSWETILQRRASYRRAFAQFDPQKVARFNTHDFHRLLQDAGIIRNRLKIQSAIGNAAAFLKVQEQFNSFDNYLWRFVNGQPIVRHRRHHRDLPPRSRESDALSRDLKSRGFTFVGTTICYAFMQAAGLVNDHLVRCFRHTQVQHP